MIRLFGSKVYISIFALILVAAAALSADAPFLYIALFSAFLHELGHITVMRLFRADIAKVSIYPFGADIRADTSHLGYGAEALVALAGPLVSAVLALIFFILTRAFQNIYFFASATANLLFFAVNIFPVKGLDGGRILLSLLLMRFDFSMAYTIFYCISAAAFGALCTFSLALLYFSGYNLSLVLICIYLYISEYSKQKILG